MFRPVPAWRGRASSGLRCHVDVAEDQALWPEVGEGIGKTNGMAGDTRRQRTLAWRGSARPAAATNGPFGGLTWGRLAAPLA